MEQRIRDFLSSASDFVWGWPLILLLFGTHLFLTVRLGFMQRYIGRAIRISLSRESEGEGDVSQFGALMTALAATIGTGNIYGVSGAVLLGGPGAVLWMWLTGVFGIATKYAEAVLAVKYRIVNEEGQMAGGPMYTLDRGLGLRWLGVLFAIFTALAAFGIGNMAQANAITEMVTTRYPEVPKLAIAIALTVGTAAVILGGIKSMSFDAHRGLQRVAPRVAPRFLPAWPRFARCRAHDPERSRTRHTSCSAPRPVDRHLGGPGRRCRCRGWTWGRARRGHARRRVGRAGSPPRSSLLRALSRQRAGATPRPGWRQIRGAGCCGRGPGR